jgi:hypothetical protein
VRPRDLAACQLRELDVARGPGELVPVGDELCDRRLGARDLRPRRAVGVARPRALVRRELLGEPRRLGELAGPSSGGRPATSGRIGRVVAVHCHALGASIRWPAGARRIALALTRRPERPIANRSHMGLRSLLGGALVDAS